MSNFVVNNFVDEFNDNLMLLSQQKNARFRGAVMEDTHVGESASVVDQLSEATAQIRTTRHGSKPIIETVHSRRWVDPVDYDWGDAIDNEDKLRLKIQLEGGYTRVGLAAINRAMDDAVLDSFFVASKTGVRGADTTALPATQVVAVDVGSSGDTQLNTDKLLFAREKLLAADVDIEDPNDQIYCAINALQEHALLEQIKVGNADYNTPIFASDETGRRRLSEWFGIKFIMTQRLNTDSSSDEEVPFWSKSGMHLGIWKDVFGDISQRLDLNRNPFHVTTGGTFGATRTEEAKVVKILCDPSAIS